MREENLQSVAWSGCEEPIPLRERRTAALVMKYNLDLISLQCDKLVFIDYLSVSLFSYQISGHISMYLSIIHIKMFVELKKQTKKTKHKNIVLGFFLIIFFYMHKKKFCPCNMQGVSE